MTTATHERASDFGTRGEWRWDEEESRYRDRGTRNGGDAERLARALGWFSIGLGLAQLAAPRRVARLIGVSDREENRKAMLAVGVRELASGIGILSRPQAAVWLWTRVAGDAMDLALLGRGLKSPYADRSRVTAATAAVAGVMLLDYFTGQQLSRGSDGRTGAERRPIHVKKTITVALPREELYRFWRDFNNLPRFMTHLESVEVLDDRRSRWRAKAPAGTSVQWDAEIVEDRKHELIAWRSLQNADVDNRGSVRFVPAPGGRGTEVHVELEYEPPGGKLGSIVAKLFGEEPGQQVDTDLRRFKQVMEVGEVVHSDASIYNRPHPARPPERAPSAQPMEGGVR